MLSNINMDGDKLFILDAAPSEAFKNEVWDKIKGIDATFSDLFKRLQLGENSTSVPQHSRHL